MNSRSDSTTKPRRLHTVLVLEDDVLIRMPICQYLRDCGYCVLEAANGLAEAGYPHRCGQSDIDMPGKMNGFSFAQWARSVRPGVDIVLAGTPERAAHVAVQLCPDGPMLI